MSELIRYTWEYTMISGIGMFSGARYASLSYALDAAMYSAMQKKSTIVNIEVYPTKT